MSGWCRPEASDRFRILESDLIPAPDISELRLAAWERKTEKSSWDDVTPKDADFIIVPWLPIAASGDLRAVTQAVQGLLDRLPYYHQYPDKHILLDGSDLDVLESWPRGHIFKTSVGYRFRDVHALPYKVFDPGIVTPIEDAEVDICFQGAMTTHPIRQSMRLWRYGWTGFRTAFEEVDPFWTLAQEQQSKLRQCYSKLMRASRFVLCPRGRALNSRRFFETLAYGRIPILYSDGAKLPLERIIPWDRFVIRVPEGFGGQSDLYIRRFKDTHDLKTASKLARDVWVTFFAPERLRVLVTASLSQVDP